jgi:hypothetical protein
MRNHHLTSSLVALLLCAAAGCATDGAAGDGTPVTGTSTYRDSSTTADGSPHQAAAPPAQSATVSLAVHGTGTLSGVDVSCPDAATGQFAALYQGQASLADGGTLSGALAATGEVTTPSGCTVSDLTVAAVTGITVRAELDATTTNCQTYCDASARADAESACEGNADQATCRSQAEASAAASCNTACTTQAHAIVAEASLGTGALGTIDADALHAGAFGDVDATFTFDHMEDAQGNRVHP